MSTTRGMLVLMSVVAAVLATALPCLAEESLPPELQGITVQEHLGGQVALDQRFTDHDGAPVTLGAYVKGDLPVLLTLNYYRCTTLCSIQLNALKSGLRELGWRPGKKFRVVTVSIDHREKPELARGKRASYLEALGMGEDVEWAFLVGTEDQVKRLASTVGFGFRYVPEQDQFAHPATLVFLSPEGKISRYLYGLDYSPWDLRFALLESAEGRVGSVADRVILSCFHYDPASKRYGPFAFGIMRVGAVITMTLLGGFLLLLWRREPSRQRPGVER